MSVNPGWGSQPLIPASYGKLERLRAIGEYGATSVLAYHPTSLPVARRFSSERS